MDESLEKDMAKMAPDSGFDLVAMNYFSSSGESLYLVEHFEKYQDALDSKKSKRNQNEYFVLYKGPGGELFYR